MNGWLAKAALYRGTSTGMISIMIRIIASTLLCGALLSACNLSSTAPAPSSASADGGDYLQGKVEVTTAPTAITQKSEPTSAPPAAEATPNRCNTDASRPTRHIRAEVTVDYGSKATSVDQVIEFVNREAAPLAEVVLDAQANQWEGGFHLAELRVNDLEVDFDLDRNRLQVSLAEALPSGCRIEIKLKFRLQPAAIRDGLRSYRGFFGYSTRQLNMGHFLPTVAARLHGAWRLHEPIGIGEQIVYEVADWVVKLRVDGAAESLQLAAPGRVSSMGAGMWVIELEDSRDFALSLSETFVVSERHLDNGMSIAVYTFADATVNDRGLELDGAAHVLREAEKTLKLFERLFGKYPYDRLVIVQGDFPDGMEFTGLVFVGSAWFYGFDGTTRNYLTLISVHEVAHQWWYARVGNDAALNPWLDEALATYSEYLFIEATYPEDKNWWWTYRVAGYFPQGQVDRTVYEFNTPREYINAVYLRGAQMLQNLRQDIGDEAFFQLLRAYYAAGDLRIAEPRLFWHQLPVEQQLLTAATRNEFLADPSVQLASLPQAGAEGAEPEGNFP